MRLQDRSPKNIPTAPMDALRAFWFALPPGLLVAAPWLLALLERPDLAPLWALGAGLGEVWVGMLGWGVKTSCYTAVLGASGVLLGLKVPWVLLPLLILLLLVECGTLLDEAERSSLARSSAASLSEAAELSEGDTEREIDVCVRVAESMADQGYLSVTWRDVAAIQAGLQAGEMPTDVVGQVIAWTLWRAITIATGDGPEE